VQKGITDGKLYEWDLDTDGEEDKMFYGLLLSVFTPEELGTIIGHEIMGVPQRIINALELKILTEMNKWVYGKQLVETNLEGHLRLQELFSNTTE
jgi:hypothetical protein